MTGETQIEQEGGGFLQRIITRGGRSHLIRFPGPAHWRDHYLAIRLQPD